MAVAAKNFLNQNKETISEKAQEVLEGNMREIVGQMKLTEMVSDRQKFAKMVLENAGPDMAELGLEIVSFNVQNFKDENGVIEDLGIDNVEKIKKDAAIAKSDARREIAIQEAENERLANEAQVAAATQMAEQNTALDMRAAELKQQSEIKKAAADMAYDIQQAEQKKELDVVQTNAKIAQMEREVELQKQKIDLRERELDATVRKEADAKLYAAEKAAQADLIKRQKDAEAKRYEQEQEAAAERKIAEANHYPAIDVLGSISRLMSAIASSEHKEAAAKMRKILAMYRENKDLIDVGMYQPGTNPKLDIAIEMMPKVNAFLQQRTSDSVTMEGTISQLVEMMEGVDI